MVMPVVPQMEREQHAFGPEEIRILASAYEDAMRSLHLADRLDPDGTAIAKRIFERAKLGELDPVRLRDYAVDMHRSPRVS